MSVNGPSKIVRDGLVLALDGANAKSYGGSGNNWRDLTNNGNATLYNTPSFVSDGKGSISFDGIDDQAIASTNFSSTSAGFTVSMTLKSTTWANQSCPCVGYTGIFDWSTGYWNVIGLISNSSGPYWYIYNTSVAPVGISVGFNTAATNTWMNLTCHYNNSTGVATSYLNGVAVATATLSGGFTVSAPISIAAYNRHCGNCFIPVTIGQVLVYNRPLTQNEIIKNYSAAKTRFGLS